MRIFIRSNSTKESLYCASKHAGNYRNFLIVASLVVLIGLSLHPLPAFAQSALEGRISQTVSALIRIVNVIIAGFIVWSGFLIAKGEHSGFHRLIYGVVGLIVANAAYLIINYFSWF